MDKEKTYEEVKVQRTIPTHMADSDGYIDQVKMALASDLYGIIKNYITYEVSDKTVTASILIERG